jgi:hypothetical protein
MPPALTGFSRKTLFFSFGTDVAITSMKGGRLAALSSRGMLKMNFKALAVAAVAAIAAVAPANAATFLLTYTATSGAPLPTTASLTITTSNHHNAAGGFDILSASGTVNGVAISGLAPLNPAGFNTDNVYFAADPILTSSGLGWTTAIGTGNLWGNSPGSYSLYEFDGNSYYIATTGTLSTNAVPEPATWALLMIGFGMVGVAARRRKAIVAA